MSVTKIPVPLRNQLFDAAQSRRKPNLFECAGCHKFFARPALQVDHIIPEVESRPEDRLNPDNLQLLCAPKGSTRWNSCHKKKTAREAADRARRNRVPGQWTPAALYGAGAVIMSGTTYQYALQGDAGAAHDWFQYSTIGFAGLFSTVLVKKGWRRLRPRRKISAGVAPQTENLPEGLNLDRIVEEAREIIGPKGMVRVDASGLDHFTIAYPKTGFADDVDEKRYALLNKVQAKIGGRWEAVWDTEKDIVAFNRRPTLERMVRHPGFDPKRRWHELPIAPGVKLDLKVTPHVLIIGTTGAGKTALMRTVIAAVADSARKDDGTRVVLADPKLIEFPGFEGWPGITEVVGEPHDLWEMALGLEAEMWERLRLIKAKKAKTTDFRKIIVVIDEYEQFFKRMNDYWRNTKDEDGKPLKKPGQQFPDAISSIQTILSMARRINIHIIIGTQSPDAAWFGGTGTRENLSGRVAVGPVDQYRARMMFDDSSIGRDVPIEFKGRATVQVGDGLPQEIQCYYTPDPFDPDDDNTTADWDHLVALGMPKEMVPSA